MTANTSLANDDSAPISVELKKLQDRDFAQEILELKDGLVEKETELEREEKLCAKNIKKVRNLVLLKSPLIKEKDSLNPCRGHRCGQGP